MGQEFTGGDIQHHIGEGDQVRAGIKALIVETDLQVAGDPFDVFKGAEAKAGDFAVADWRFEIALEVFGEPVFDFVTGTAFPVVLQFRPAPELQVVGHHLTAVGGVEVVDDASLECGAGINGVDGLAAALFLLASSFPVLTLSFGLAGIEDLHEISFAHTAVAVDDVEEAAGFSGGETGRGGFGELFS